MPITKHCGLDDFNKRHLFSRSSEERDQGATMVGLDLSSWLADSCLLSVCSHGLSHGERCGEREGVGREQREREKEKAWGRETHRESEEEGEKIISLCFPLLRPPIISG